MAITDFELGENINLAFWIVFAASALTGLSIMVLEGINLVRIGELATGFEVVSVAMIFLMMSIASFLIILFAIVDDRAIFKGPLLIGQDTGQELGIIFYLGFFIWYGLQAFKSGGFFKSITAFIPTLPTASILSSVSSTGLTNAQNYFINGMMAPWVEEVFFLFAIPLIILTVWYFFNIRNKWLEYIMITLIPAFLFASFHVNQKTFTGFWIAAFSFRAILQGIIYADQEFNILPKIAVLGSFIFGAHLANNIYQLGGIIKFLIVLSANTTLFALTILPFIITAIWAVQAIFKWKNQPQTLVVKEVSRT